MAVRSSSIRSVLLHLVHVFVRKHLVSGLQELGELEGNYCKGLAEHFVLSGNPRKELAGIVRPSPDTTGHYGFSHIAAKKWSNTFCLSSGTLTLHLQNGPPTGRAQTQRDTSAGTQKPSKRATHELLAPARTNNPGSQMPASR